MTLSKQKSNKGLAFLIAATTIIWLGLPLSSPVRANHPSNSCLDLVPEMDTNGTNTTHRITAYLRNFNAGPPPTCAGNKSPTTNVLISFEIDGDNDPNNDGNTPESPDLSCEITATPVVEGGVNTFQCSIQYTGTDPGEDEIRGWIDHDKANPPVPGVLEADQVEGQDESADPGTGCVPPETGPEPDCTDVVAKRWVDFLECFPETDANPVGTSHTITCRVTDGNGDPRQGAFVDAEASGTNDPQEDDHDPSSPDFSCGPTDGNGECSFTHTTGGTDTDQNNTGRTTYRAWVDEDNDDSTTEADEAEGPDAGEPTPDDPNREPQGGTNVPGDMPEQDNTDVVTKDWTPAEGARFLDCDDQSGNDDEVNPHGAGPASNEAYTCRVHDRFGNRVGDGDASTPQTQEDLPVFAEVRGPEDAARGGSGVNDPDPAGGSGQTGQPNADPGDTTSYNTPDYQCVAGKAGAPGQQEGVCTITVTQNENEIGSTAICFWVEQTQTPMGSATTHPCDQETGPPNDESENPSPDPTNAETQEGNDNADQVRKIWAIGNATVINCRPETASNPAGSTHTVTCKATDSSGNPIPGTQIDVEARSPAGVSGVNDPDNGYSPTTPDFSCVAGEDDPVTQDRNEAGECSIEHGPDARADRDAQTPAANPNNSTNAAGRTEYVAWLDTSGSDEIEEADDNEGRCASPPTNPDEAGCQSPGSPPQPGTGCPVGVEPDCTDVVEKTWTASRLECRPESDTNPSGTTHRVICRTTDENNNPVGGTKVDAEASGANDPDNRGDAGGPNSPGGNNPPDFTCTTATQDDPSTPDNELGECPYTHSGPGAGVTTYRNWIDDDGDDANGDEGDTTEGPDAGDPPNEPAGSPNTPGAQDEPDDTDVITKTWLASRLDCSPETARNNAGTTHTVTCTARDSTGAPAAGQIVTAEATGANDPDNGNTPQSPDFQCTQPTDANGQCSFTHGGQGQQQPSSPNAVGTTTYRAWIEDPSTAATDEDATEGRCSGDTTAPDDQNCGTTTAGAKAEPDNTDVVEKTWTARLECTPEEDSNPVDTSHTVTCKTTDANANPVSAQQVDVEATGNNDPDDNSDPTSPDFTCTTGNNGECQFTHAQGQQGGTNEAGQTVYRAWIDSDGQNPTFEGDANEGPDAGSADEPAGGNNVPGSTGEPDNTDVVLKNWIGPGLTCVPDQDFNPAGTQHQFTCTARDANGQPQPNKNIDVEATGANDPDTGNSQTSPDFTCTTNQNGECTITHGGNTNGTGTTTYRAWIDENGDASSEADQNETRAQNDPDNTDVVEKTWSAARLDCNPETDSNPSGTAHSVTCQARDGGNTPVSGQNVDVELVGANDPDNANTPATPDFTCTTGSDGTCTFTHGPGGTGTTAVSGTSTYTAWVDVDGVNSSSEADTTEARDESGSGAGSTPEPDITDVVHKTWTAGGLDCTPETMQNRVGTQHQVTCTARDGSGNTVAGTRVDMEATGANDPDGNSDFKNPDFTCTTQANGSCTVTHGGGNQTTNNTGTTTYRAWIDSDNDNNTTEADPTEARDESGTGAGMRSEPDDTDVVEKAWVTGPRTITCTPESATNPTGTQHTVTCTVRDRQDQPLSGVAVTFSESGPGQFTTSPDQTTDANGQAKATVTSSEVGTQSITGTIAEDTQGEPDTDECDRAAGDPANAPAGRCSDSVTKTWAGGQQPTQLRLTPAEATNKPGTEHTFTARVTDQNGNPVEGATVQWSTSGVGTIVSQESVTDANGEANAVVSSNEPGDQRVTASTSPCAPNGDCDDRSVKHWGPSRCTIFGTNGPDTLVGTSDTDVICGFGGNDVIAGRGDADLVLAGRGSDTVKGGGGGDVLKGGGGNDKLNGNRGNDSLVGGRGRDALNGGAGSDRCRGGPGRDSETNCER